MKTQTVRRVAPDRAERFSPAPDMGLTSAQVSQRIQDGLVNVTSASQGKSYVQILRDNLLTLFNLLNFALAACVILVGSYTNALFIGVILCNIIIGTYQEIRAKRTIERLKVVSAPTARAVRDGRETELAVEQLVLDDITVWRAGMQLSADCVVVEGAVEVNESLLTGESDALPRQVGDTLMSGSFIVSGECRARVEHVGDDNYAARIAGDAKQLKKPNSELMRSLNLIIKTISFAIVPIGGALFAKQHFIMDMSLRDSVVNTVAAMIGMIPEGLILLTSVALAVGVVRLARRRTLVQQLYCIETLARVDTLCLDKTGTITTGDMQVTEVVPLDGSYEYATRALTAFIHAMADDNPTNRALRERFGDGTSDWTCVRTEPFSSARKWSAAQFEREGAIVLGAPEFVLGADYERVRAQVEDYAARGLRVLVLAQSSAPLGDRALPAGALRLCALVILGDTLRAEAPATLEYFARQDVDIKVISGDNPVTVASVARRAGLKGADKLIDLSTLADDEVADAADRYTVFGRVTPQRKRVLVNALKQRGHTVAMTGDGVNDVLALKDADCSIAMANGSDAARQVANIVLLDSNFASMPAVVAEGRRVINNISRSASLFLTKTIFSSLLAVLMLVLMHGYPFQPIQLTLFSSLAIGFPSFVLALEPNSARVRGNFLLNVLGRALPAALTIVLGVSACIAMSYIWDYPHSEVSTMAVLFTVCVGLISLARVCRPFNLLRAALLAVCTGAFVACVLLMPGLFQLVELSRDQLIMLCVMVACALPFMLALVALMHRIPVFAKNDV